MADLPLNATPEARAEWCQAHNLQVGWLLMTCEEMKELDRAWVHDLEVADNLIYCERPGDYDDGVTWQQKYQQALRDIGLLQALMQG